MTIWPWSRRGRNTRELDDELRFHREMRIAEFMSRGHTRDQAERLARERFGDVQDLTEYCNRMDTHIATRTRRSAWFSDLRLDLWHGLRQVRQHHGVALVAVLTLGLGIGATTATYAVVHKLLISPVPGIYGDRVVRLSRTNKDRSFSISATTEIADAWRAGVPALEEVATYGARDVSGDFGSGKEALEVGVMSPNFLSVFGIGPAMGRAFAIGDVNVALITSGVWRQRYGASANVLGKSIFLDGVAHTIVGVLPRKFVVPFATGKSYDVWIPLSPAGPRVFPTVIARLRPGTTKESLQRELDTILTSLAASPGGHGGQADSMPWQAMISRPQDDLGQATEDSVLVLFGAVAIVLLAGCANVANLLLARAQTRQREFVIRYALGAGRGRLVRQLLAESSLLASGGWLLGLAVTVGCIALAQALRPSSLAALDGLRLEPHVVWISLLISVITAGLFGLAPALVAAGRRPSEDMRRQTRSVTADRRVGRWRNALVVVEVGLSVVLLVGGGLLIRTLWAMQHAPLGFDPTHLVSAEITLPEARYPTTKDRVPAFQRLLDRVKVLPGVTQVTWALGVPPNLGISVGTVQIDGRSTPGGREFIGFNTASPDYFAVTKTPIVEGRLYDPRAQPEDVIMVSQSMARRHWPGESAVGKRMRLSTEGPWSTIVGVVGDVTVPRPGNGTRIREVVYSPFDGSIDGATLVIRGSAALTGLFPALTAAAAQIDPQVKISSITSVTDALAESQALPRFIGSILAAFAIMAVLLASVGLYGVIAYTVTRRWREMGIRLALGARPSDVVRPVLIEGAVMTAAGLAAGLAGAYAATGALRSLLFQVQPLDLTTFVMASALLAGVSFTAIYMPARRATRVNPLLVLREE